MILSNNAFKTAEVRIQIHEEKLKTYISEHRLEVVGNPIMAFYNSPKTLPFLRRNEVMFKLVEKEMNQI